ncbi:aldo/keto reductase [Sphingorhabdus sp.]|uniref:aldo/keto reductase n=1 Tax=Sphingorhabdus sp. TaxID=1902408 RepID=UPI00405442B2
MTLPTPSRTRKLGKSGIEISSLAWGMWRFAGLELSAARGAIDAAFEAGITLFDTADIYGFGEQRFGKAEELLGQVFADAPAHRDRMVLATKGGITPPTPYDSSAEYLTKAIDDSLTRLRTDRIDLWQIHRPDVLTHPQEIARTIEDAHKAGKIRAFGVSNFTQAQITALAQFSAVPIVSTQPELSPLRIDTIENGELDQAIAMDLAVMAWSPLGGGRIGEPQNVREQNVAAALSGVAAAHNVSCTSAAYSWIMAHPARPIPIVGSQNPARIIEAADAFKIQWTRADWYSVLVAARGVPLP